MKIPKRYDHVRKADAILTSDWHLREDTPVCRTDDFWEAQWFKVGFISKLVQECNCIVLHAGDLFHYWKPSPYLLSETIKHLPERFMTVYGQHDLPQHNLGLAHKSGVYTLLTSNKLELLKEAHFGQEPKLGSLFWPGIERKILIWHRLTWSKKKPWPDCPEPDAEKILRKYKDFDLIVTGDNHSSFTIKDKNGHILVNPGSITRQSANQLDHSPSVYMWNADENSVEQVLLPFNKNVISREHIDRKQDHDKRIEAFVSRLNDDWKAEFSFEENLNRFERENDIHPSVMNVIRKAMENE